MKLRSAGMSLIELVVAIALVGIILAVVFGAYTFFLTNIERSLKLSNTHMQIDFAMEDIKLHAMSAIQIDDGYLFPAAVSSSRSDLAFRGENDVYNITPDNLTDNAHYRYYVSQSAPALGLIREKSFANGVDRETLIDAKFGPEIWFNYTQDTEPNIMTVTIEAGPHQRRVSKSETVRFWFVDILQ